MPDDNAGRRTDYPPWCSHDHRRDIPGRPEQHSSDALWVPATRLIRIWTDGRRSLEVTAIDLVVCLAQPIESPEAWLTIAEAEDSSVEIELSVGSARRLVRAMATQLAVL